MNNHKDILVTTTSSLDGLEVKQYLKPISAHIVAGTNFLSDFFASFSDVFGGRSQAYQKQLSSLYSESIERLRIAAYEIGANCIIGLKVDLDEISGKGKSMFMITAMGTAVVVDDSNRTKSVVVAEEMFENVSFEKIKVLQRRREVIQSAQASTLNLEDDIWEFITNNQVYEVYDYVINKLNSLITYANENQESFNKFYERTLNYISILPENKRIELLYGSIATGENEDLFLKLSDIVDDLKLLDLSQVLFLLKSQDFKIQKRATKLVTFDKPFYNKQDVEQLNTIAESIKVKFPERGNRSMKKQLLSSKEKEVWTCECGKTNDLGYYCTGCKRDIYGFTVMEVAPIEALAVIENKISLISEYIK